MQSHNAAKRRKEIARQDKQREKEAKRLERGKDKAKRDPDAPDPDIADIVPGPQPPQE
jgi:hypothetical protein